jgi:hypothetical protein
MLRAYQRRTLAADALINDAADNCPFDTAFGVRRIEWLPSRSTVLRTLSYDDFIVVSIPRPAAISQWLPVPVHQLASARSEQLRFVACLTLGSEFQETDVLEREFHPEWGYLAPGRRFIRTLRAILIATAVGAVAGGGIVLLIVSGAPEDSRSVAARTLVPPEVEVIAQPSEMTSGKLLSTEQHPPTGSRSK